MQIITRDGGHKKQDEWNLESKRVVKHLWINNGRINCLKEKNLDERKFIALQNANLLHCKKLLFELIVE